MPVSKAIILAAGLGSRISSYTKKKPKCLLKIPNSKHSIIYKQIQMLKKNKIHDIFVITGFKSNLIKRDLKAFKNIRFGFYPYYKSTNNLNTLLFFKEELNENLICLFADVVFENEILKKLIKIKKSTTAAVDLSKSLQDTMRVKIKNQRLIKIGSHIKVENSHGNFIGLFKFSKKNSKILANTLKTLKSFKKDYYTLAVNKMIKNGSIINFFNCKKYFWKEIDTLKDYNYLKKHAK